ncbi:MAG: thioesterase family protein [Rudaea sp.]|nr:thioesterase family protein [Rudaea sp.]
MTRPDRPVLIDVPIALRWRDLDAFNHVNNSTFMTYLEEARLLWFSRLDGSWLTDSHAPVVAAININYRAQLAWPRQISVQLHCERLGTTSLTLSHRIVDAADRGKTYSDGNVVLVWIEPSSGKPVPLPEAIRRACQ